jgi:hypothetical protein
MRYVAIHRRNSVGDYPTKEAIRSQAPREDKRKAINAIEAAWRRQARQPGLPTQPRYLQYLDILQPADLPFLDTYGVLTNYYEYLFRVILVS